jgi:uncharacterized membrane-anchored protein YhcB (DUF1043 family)
MAEDLSPDSGVSAEFAALSLEEQEEQRRQWQAELAKVEDEIATFRHVLASKVKQSNDLKSKLGITVWRELQEDMSQSIKNVKDTAV